MVLARLVAAVAAKVRHTMPARIFKSMAVSVASARAKFAAITLEEYGRADGCLKIVLQLFHACDVGSEHQVLYVDVQRQPVGWQHTKASTEIHRKILITGKIDAANAADHIEGAGHGEIATDEDLPRTR